MHFWKIYDRYKSVIMLTIIAYSIISTLFSLSDRWRNNDFNFYYASSKSLLDGENPYNFDFKQTFPRFLFEYDARMPHATNPPTLIYLFAPFAYLNPLFAFNAWLIFQFSCLIASLFLIKKIINNKQFDHIYPEFCALVFLSDATHLHFYSGQTQYFLFFLILSSFYFYKRKKIALSLCIMSVASLIKIFPLALLVWMLLKGKLYKHTLYILEITIITVAIIYSTNTTLWQDFILKGVPVLKQYAVNTGANYSIQSIILNIAYLLSGRPETYILPKFYTYLADIVGILIVSISYYLSIRYTDCIDAEFSVVITGMLLASTVCWGHYLVFMFFPIAVILSRITTHVSNKFKLSIILTIFLLTTQNLWYTMMGNNYIINTILNYMPLYGMLIAVLTLLAQNKLATQNTPVNF